MTVDDWKERLLNWMESALARRRQETAELERLLVSLRAETEQTREEASALEESPATKELPGAEQLPGTEELPGAEELPQVTIRPVPPTFLAKTNGHKAPAPRTPAPKAPAPNAPMRRDPVPNAHIHKAVVPKPGKEVSTYGTHDHEPHVDEPHVHESHTAVPSTGASTEDAVDADSKNRVGLPVSMGGRMLLVGSGSHWCGLSWDEVLQVSLVADVALPQSSPDRYSLTALLASRGLSVDSSTMEPYAVSFRHDGGEAVLTCEHVDFPDLRRAQRWIDYVLKPSERAGRRGPVLEPFDGGPGPLPAADADPRSDAAPDVMADVEATVTTSSAGAAPTSFPETNSFPETATFPGTVSGPPAFVTVEPFQDATTPVRSDPTTVAPQSETRAASALVAIRYLPARVSVSRALRQSDWTVQEVADLSSLPEILPGEFDAIFIDISERLPATVQDLLGREDLAGSTFIGVGSRLRMGSDAPPRPLFRAPRLFFPFTDEEARVLIEGLAPRF